MSLSAWRDSDQTAMSRFLAEKRRELAHVVRINAKGKDAYERASSGAFGSGMDKGRLSRTLRANDCDGRDVEVMVEPFGCQLDELLVIVADAVDTYTMSWRLLIRSCLRVYCVSPLATITSGST